MDGFRDPVLFQNTEDFLLRNLLVPVIPRITEFGHTHLSIIGRAYSLARGIMSWLYRDGRCANKGVYKYFGGNRKF